MNICKNRQGLAAAAALAFGALVLAVPSAAAQGFAGGTALCLQSVLPALFPFFVVCELLTAAPPPATLLRPVQRVLGLESAETARALLLSWVGGYAVCARLAGQLYGAGRITRRDAVLLQVLGCCSGPGFVIGCVGGALLGNVRLGVVLYAAQIGANLGAGAVCLLLSHAVGANMVRPLAVSDAGGLSGNAQPLQSVAGKLQVTAGAASRRPSPPPLCHRCPSAGASCFFAWSGRWRWRWCRCRR